MHVGVFSPLSKHILQHLTNGGESASLINHYFQPLSAASSSLPSLFIIKLFRIYPERQELLRITNLLVPSSPAMPTNSSVKRALSAIEKDPSKLLGVKINGKEITTKEYIPRAGKLNTKH